MNELGHFLFVLSGLLAINALLAGVLWARQKTPIYRSLFLLWIAAFASGVAQGTLQTHPWMTFGFGVSCTVLNFALADFIRRALDLRPAWGAYLVVSAIGLAGSGVAFVAQAPFWVAALPVAVGAAASLLHVVYLGLRRPASLVGVTGGAAIASVLLFALHELDYPFLGDDPQFTALGFILGTVAVFAISVTGPAVILEKSGAERRAMENEVRRLNRQLESRIEETLAAVRGRDEFLSVASHELRTPLTSLRLQIRLAQQNPQGGIPLPERLRVIERQSARLEALVSQLLDVSRVAARRLELHYADADLAAITTDVTGRMAPELDLVKSALQVSVSGPIRGQWDSLRVEQVLVNLLANAVKFGPGQPIEVRLEDTGEQARLTVRDHGIGVKPEDRSRIFLPFERANPSRHYGGLGLGLWITAQIVEAHGGKIDVNSPPGEGAEFTVLLPKQPPQASARSSN